MTSESKVRNDTKQIINQNLSIAANLLNEVPYYENSRIKTDLTIN